MTTLRLSHLGHIMRRQDSPENTTMLGKDEGSRKKKYGLTQQRKPQPSKESAAEKLDGKPLGNPSQNVDIPVSQKVEQVAAENLKTYDSKTCPSVLNTEMPYTIQEDEIAITLENQEILPEVSKFADRELVHFEPPKSPNKFCSHELLNRTLLDPQENKDFADARKLHLSEKPPSTLGNNAAYSMNDQVQRSSMSCMSRLTPRSAVENRIVNQSPLAFQDTRVKRLLKTMDENLPVPTWQYQEKDSNSLLVMETPQLLPRLRQVALRDALTKKISWMGLSQQQPSGSFPFCTIGSRPPIFPLTQQQTFTVRSLKQSKEKSKGFFNNGSVRKNFAQLKHTAKDMDLNLPVLSLPYQTKSEKKSEILRLDFT